MGQQDGVELVREFSAQYQQLFADTELGIGVLSLEDALREALMINNPSPSQ